MLEILQNEYKRLKEKELEAQYICTSVINELENFEYNILKLGLKVDENGRLKRISYVDLMKINLVLVSTDIKVKHLYKFVKITNEELESIKKAIENGEFSIVSNIIEKYTSIRVKVTGGSFDANGKIIIHANKETAELQYEAYGCVDRVAEFELSIEKIDEDLLNKIEEFN